MKKVQRPIYIDPELDKKMADNNYYVHGDFPSFARAALVREVKVQEKTYSAVSDINDGVKLVKQGIEKLK